MTLTLGYLLGILPLKDWCAILATFAILGVVIAVPILAIVGTRRGQRKMEAIVAFANAQTRVSAEPNVHLKFHTYHGFLTLVQTEHNLYLPSDVAHQTLRSFRRFNFTWGMMNHASILVPFFTFSEYISQAKSIRKQVKNLAARS